MVGNGLFLLAVLIFVIAAGALVIERQKRRADERERVKKEAITSEVRKAKEAALRARFRERDESCYGCHYWDVEAYGRVNPPEETASNECHRNPPSLDPSGEWIWPYTGPLEWCGEYKEFVRKEE